MATLDDLMKMMTTQNEKLDDIQKEISDSKEEIKNYVDIKLEEYNQTVKSMQIKLQSQEKEITKLQQQFLQKDIEDKKRNVIIHKIPENEKSQEDLINIILNILNTKLDIDINISKKDIDFLYRIGKKGSSIRPIVLGFTTLILKETVMRRKRSLEQNNVAISEDLPQAIREKRKGLAPVVKSLFEKGYKVHLKHDSIIVNGERWSVERANEAISSSQSVKRPASTLSPSDNMNLVKKQNNIKSKASEKTVSCANKTTTPTTPSVKQYMFPIVGGAPTLTRNEPTDVIPNK